MTLGDTIKTIEAVAKSQPAIGMIVRNDIFRMNAAPQLKYGVFAWLQGSHSGNVEANETTFQFTFFYVDRLIVNKQNEIDIQSVGVSVLDNIIKTLDSKGLFVDSSYSFQTFNQRFTDECAGVFVNVSFNVAADSVCNEIYRDDDEFLIW